MELFLLWFQLFILTIQSASNCNADDLQPLRNANNVPAPGNVICNNALNADDTGSNDLWCQCFKFPEAVAIVQDIVANSATGNCQQNTNSEFTLQEALTACTSQTCSQVGFESLCRSKKCTWNNVTSTCSDNTVCTDENSLVNSASASLQVPWINHCDTLLAVYDHYHNKMCDSLVTEMMDAINLFAPGTYPDNTTKLRDICCQACWYQDAGVPYVYSDICTQDSDCNDAVTAGEYFCADCSRCNSTAAGADPLALLLDAEDCGICNITRYGGNACVSQTACTNAKAVSGNCGLFVHDVCLGEEIPLADLQIPQCLNYWYANGDETAIKDNMCPGCFNNANFTPLDCVFKRQDMFTLQENDDFCDQSNCTAIMAKDACISNTVTNCVWLTRLVKGKCVPDPCYNVTTGQEIGCSHLNDICLMCVTDPLGELSCVFNPAREGEECNDDVEHTNNDVCDATAGRCSGTPQWESLLKPRSLGQENCPNEEGTTYTCDDGFMNVTHHYGQHCANATSNQYGYVMDGSCANVVTDESGLNRYYFSGTCTNSMAYRYECNRTAYLQYLTSIGTEFVAPTDSASSLSIILLTLVVIFVLF